MSNVIIYTNSNGGVSTCIPTGEISIEEVLKKDCPQGAIIVDSATLPNQDNDFYDAWELSGSTVSVNIAKAQAIATNQLNAQAKAEATHRATNSAIGVANKLDDAAFLALLTTARTAIGAATTTQAIRDAVKPVSDAIAANA